MKKLDSKELATLVRKNIVQLTFQNRASHVGGAMSIADVLSVLYAEIMNYSVKDFNWQNRDRLFYSKGHACTALYSVLQNVGFFSEEDLATFTHDGSFFTSHVNHKIPGIELSTGSLGHAFSVGCGTALAAKRKSADWHTYVIVSDGELNEGSNWEAILFAPHHNLNNLTLIVDYNKIQSFGTTKEVLELDPLAEKFRAFGWETAEIDGHNHNEIIQAFGKRNGKKPLAIIAHTIKGKGVDFMEDKLLWHYKSPSEEEFNAALKQLDMIKL